MFSLIMIVFLLFSTFTCTPAAYASNKPDLLEPTNCPVVENETIHIVMERICEMCHEFSSHTQPNLRAECRANCFTTDTFRRCLAVFTPRRHSRHLHRHAHKTA